VKRFVSVFLLAGGLLVAGVANSATVLGTGAISSGSYYFINTAQLLGFQFTTGSGQTNLQSIDMAMGLALTESYTFRLYLSSGNGLPANNATPLATYTASSISTTAYNNSLGTLTTITFGGALSSYLLAANTSYVLTVEGQVGSSQGFKYSQTPATQLNSSGWTSSVGALYSINSGATWVSTSDAFIFNLSATTNSPTPSAVPTLSEWAQLMLALMVIGIAWHFHNHRQNSY
jgi:hypothetical protein